MEGKCLIEKIRLRNILSISDRVDEEEIELVNKGQNHLR
jgi:hypothetical protein